MTRRYRSFSPQVRGPSQISKGHAEVSKHLKKLEDLDFFAANAASLPTHFYALMDIKPACFASRRRSHQCWIYQRDSAPSRSARDRIGRLHGRRHRRRGLKRRFGFGRSHLRSGGACCFAGGFVIGELGSLDLRTRPRTVIDDEHRRNAKHRNRWRDDRGVAHRRCRLVQMSSTHRTHPMRRFHLTFPVGGITRRPHLRFPQRASCSSSRGDAIAQGLHLL